MTFFSHSLRRPTLIVGAVLIQLAAGWSAAPAQRVSEDQVKAAYLYNFAKFVEWPSQKFATPAAPIRFCVFRDASFQSELGTIAKGKAIAGHSLEVAGITEADEARACHIVFVSSAHDRHAAQVIEAVRGANVLTVGETTTFLEEGGTISFILESEHVHFEINHKAANGSQLYVSSRLLGLASRVIE